MHVVSILGRPLQSRYSQAAHTLQYPGELTWLIAPFSWCSNSGTGTVKLS